MNETCRTCRLWDFDDEIRMKSAQTIPRDYFGACLQVHWPHSDDDESEESKVLRMTASMFSLSDPDGGPLLTKPSFGCNQWEGKE